MRRQVGIIGAGELGQAMAVILKADKPALWDIDAKKVPGQGALSEIAAISDVLCLCIPSWAVRQAAGDIEPFIKKGAIVVTLSKGLEERTRLTMPAVLQEVLGEKAACVLLSGPMLAEELADGLRGAAVAASRIVETGEALVDLFAQTNLHVECSRDVDGVAMAGVLKNIYAIGLGMVEGLSLGTNVCGWYVQMAVTEMADVLERMGGERQTAYGPAGLADFVATGLSAGSRNQQVGMEIATRGELCLTSEGCASLPSVRILLADYWDEFTVLRAVSESVERPGAARAEFMRLFA